MLRTRLQFADLDKLRGVETSPVWEKSDSIIAQYEGAHHVSGGREKLKEVTKPALLQMHSVLFDGVLRRNSMKPLFRGQDCPDPQFIDRSLDNFFSWLTAESLAEIHPIERAALVMTRLVDIWPFEIGNVTAGIMLANAGLRQAGLSPFFVMPEHKKEFNTVLAQAMAIETQPLVNAIYRTIKREMEALAQR
jgi:Fic family protein